jgi:hypothetical protein
MRTWLWIMVVAVVVSATHDSGRSFSSTPPPESHYDGFFTAILFGICFFSLALGAVVIGSLADDRDSESDEVAPSKPAPSHAVLPKRILLMDSSGHVTPATLASDKALFRSSR